MNKPVPVPDRPAWKRALITGGSGFVGRVLCRELSDRGLDFVQALRREDEHAPVSVVVGEIGPETRWATALSGVDLVVHLAARVHVMRESAVDSLSAFRRVNTEGTLNLARQAVASGVRRFVFVSSVKVNGEGGQRAYSEEDLPAPEDAYAQSKWEAERGLREIAANSTMEVVILRPTLVYGPGVAANFLRLMQTAKLGLPLPFGRIRNSRSLVFVENLVDFIICCMSHPMASNQVFLVSDGDDLSTPELLRRLGSALHKPAKQIPVPAWLLVFAFSLFGRPDFARRLSGSLQVDISRARTVLGWVPPVTVDDGLRRTAEHFLDSSTKRCSETFW